MADPAGLRAPAHSDLVRSGRDAVADWRKEHPGGRLRLAGADLRDARLSGLDLRHADLRTACLAGAVLESADLFRADLAGADLSGALLDGADLRETGLSGTTLVRARLAGADLAGACANCGEVDARGARLPRARLAGADLRGADLRGADLREADLEDADLSAADLRGADLSRVRVGWATFYAGSRSHRPASGPSVRFDEADLSGAVADQADLVAASFVGARLVGTNLDAANLVEANLVDVEAAHASLRGTDLTGADLRGARAPGARLERTVLIGARLQRTDLDSAGLAGAWLGATVLIDASLTEVVGLDEVRHAGPTWLDERTASRAGAGFAAACGGGLGWGRGGRSDTRWLVAVESLGEPFGAHLVRGLREAGFACWAVPRELVAGRPRVRVALVSGADRVIVADPDQWSGWVSAVTATGGSSTARILRAPGWVPHPPAPCEDLE